MIKGVEVEVEEEEVLVEEEWLGRGGQREGGRRADDGFVVLRPFLFVLLPAFPPLSPPPSRQPLALPLFLLPGSS